MNLIKLILGKKFLNIHLPIFLFSVVYFIKLNSNIWVALKRAEVIELINLRIRTKYVLDA